MTSKQKPFILIISLLLVSGFLMTSLASYYVSISSVRSQITLNELPLTSDNIYSEIQRDLLRPIFISSLMANDTFLRDWIISGEEDPQKIIRYLKEIQMKYKTFTSFFVSDRTRIYYHADGILKKVSPDEERDNWYFRVRNMKTDYEINVDPDMANKDTMTIFINYRVYDYQGKYIGATGVGLTVFAVKNLIETYQRRYDRNIFFVDEHGNLTLFGTNMPKDKKQLSQMEGISALADRILSEPKGVYKYQRHGNTIHVNSRYIPEFNWYLIVEQTEDKATRQILNTLLVNLLICAVITLVVLVLTKLIISNYQQKLEKMATTDKLTGIYNRQAFDLLFSRIIKESQRRKFNLSMILFDIDHFKQVNDTYGHMAGDAVIQKVVDVTINNIRATDIFCRWGGEEFLILLEGCPLEEAYQIAEKIRVAIKSDLVVYGDNEIPVAISAGVAQYEEGETREKMINRADQALYQAKQNGRDRCEKSITTQAGLS